jgi:hypothetical protein
MRLTKVFLFIGANSEKYGHFYYFNQSIGSLDSESVENYTSRAFYDVPVANETRPLHIEYPHLLFLPSNCIHLRTLIYCTIKIL